MSTVPRALRRARLWTAGLMTASTVLVGAIGIHLAEAQTQAVATQTSSTTDDSAGPSSSTGSSGSSDDSSSSDDTTSNDTTSGSGFAAVAPVGGSNAQPQTSSGGS